MDNARTFIHGGNFKLMEVQKVHLTKQCRISTYLSHKVCPQSIQNNVSLDALS